MRNRHVNWARDLKMILRLFVFGFGTSNRIRKYAYDMWNCTSVNQWALYISGVRTSGHGVKPKMAAMSYVGSSTPTRSFMFTCNYVKTAQGNWNRRNSGPPQSVTGRYIYIYRCHHKLIKTTMFEKRKRKSKHLGSLSKEERWQGWTPSFNFL